MRRRRLGSQTERVPFSGEHVVGFDQLEMFGRARLPKRGHSVVGASELASVRTGTHSAMKDVS